MDAVVPAAVVIGLDCITGLQTARILARRGVPVIGIAADPGHFCCRTRLVREVIASDTGSEVVVDALLALASRLSRRAVLFPCTDASVMVIARGRDRLEPHFHVMLPPTETLERLQDKIRFSEFAEEIGVPSPRMRILRSREEAESAAGELEFPCVLKPAVKTAKWQASTSAKVFRIDTPEEMIATYERCAGWSDSLLVQEWIDGPESELYSCNCYYDEASRPLVTFVARKLRQWPPGTGTSCLGEECRNDAVLALTYKLFGEARYSGLGYIEVKRNPETGRHYVIEANVGRPTGRSAIAEAGGVELIQTMYAHAIGAELPAAREQRYTGAKWIFWRQDLRSAFHYWQRGELTFSEWRASLAGRKACAVLSWSDPGPFVADLAHGLAFGARAVARRIRALGYLDGRLPYPSERAPGLIARVVGSIGELAHPMGQRLASIAITPHRPPHPEPVMPLDRSRADRAGDDSISPHGSATLTRAGEGAAIVSPEPIRPGNMGAAGEWPLFPGPPARTFDGASLRAVATAGLAIATITMLVRSFDAPLVLIAAVAVVGALPLLRRPELATVVTVFLLYINFPAILTKQHGLSSLIAGSFILLLGIPLARHLVVRRSPMRADPTLALMFGLLGAYMVSSLFAIDRTIATGRIVMFLSEGLLLYWLVLNVVRSHAAIRRVVWTLLAAGALLGGLSVYQEATGSYSREFGGLAYRNYVPEPDEESDRVLQKRETWDRAQGPVNDPNRFAQILIVLLPLAVWAHRSSRRGAGRLLAMGFGALCFAGIVLTLSRGAFVALALMAAAMIAVRWIRFTRTTVLAMVIGIAVLGAMAPRVPFLMSRIESVTGLISILGEEPRVERQADGATLGRMTLMLAAWRVFLDHPVIGVGPGQFPPFYSMEYSRLPENNLHNLPDGDWRAHSLYLEIAAETGFVGLLIFLAAAGVLCVRLWRARSRWMKTDPNSADLATALLLSVLAYFFTGIFLHLSYERYYWFLLALSGAALYVIRTRRPSTQPRRPRAPRSRLSTATRR